MNTSQREGVAGEKESVREKQKDAVKE